MPGRLHPDGSLSPIHCASSALGTATCFGANGILSGDAEGEAGGSPRKQAPVRRHRIVPATRKGLCRVRSPQLPGSNIPYRPLDRLREREIPEIPEILHICEILRFLRQANGLRRSCDSSLSHLPSGSAASGTATRPALPLRLMPLPLHPDGSLSPVHCASSALGTATCLGADGIPSGDAEGEAGGSPRAPVPERWPPNPSHACVLTAKMPTSMRLAWNCETVRK